MGFVPRIKRSLLIGAALSFPRRLLTRLVVMGGLLTGFPAFAQQPPVWKPDANIDGFQVDTRDVPGTHFPELRITTTVAAPPERLCDAIFARKLSERLERGFKKRIIIRELENERWLYEQIAVPLVADRDYVIHVKLEKPASDETCEVSFETQEDAAYPPVRGIVRIPVIRGSWTLKPASAGRVEIVYVIYSDPGGWVPAFLVRLGQRDAALAFVKTILARAQQPEGATP